MNDTGHIRRRAAAERDAARSRVRRLTGIALAASVAVVGSIASYVAGAAPGKKASKEPARTTTSARKKTGQVAVPAAPAAPSLIPSSSPSSIPSSSPSQSPVQAPVQTQSPPVAVSGGS